MGESSINGQTVNGQVIDPKKLIFINLRQLLPVQFEMVRLVRQMGVVQPIVITENLEILDGEQRVLAALECGLEEIPYRIGGENEYHPDHRPYVPRSDDAGDLVGCFF